MWYMPMIIGIYALIPVIANTLNADTDNYIRIPILFFFITMFIYPTVSACSRIVFPNARVLTNQIGGGFSGGIYGVYLVAGFVIRKGALKKLRSVWLLCSITVSFFSAVWIQLWSYSNSVRYSLWYDNPFLLIASVCIFEGMSRIKQKKSDFVIWLAGFAFPIYLVHYPIKLLLMDTIMRIQNNKEIKVIILWTSLLLISLSVSYVFSKIPIIGNYLLYRKWGHNET